MTQHVDLHLMACFVSTSENPSTASRVKHRKILDSSNSNVTLLDAVKDQLFCPLLVHAHMSHESLYLKPYSNFLQHWDSDL